MIHITPINLDGYSKASKWCGPAALGMLTGISMAEATEHLTRTSGQTYAELEGTYADEMILALSERGYTAKPVDILTRFPDANRHGPTLRRFMNNRLPHEMSNPMLIGLYKHWIVSHWGLLGDNSTGGHMVLANRFPKLGRNVEQAFVIEKMTT